MAQARFSGDPKTRWLTEQTADRQMELLEDFWFDDRSGKRWDASRTSLIDGASIPRPLWSLVGSPYTGDYRRASIVHDVACVAATGNTDARKAADKMFYQACRAGGCSIPDSIVLYIGVRIGAQWGAPQLAGEDGIHVHETRLDVAVRTDFQEIADEVMRRGETDDPDVIEQRVDSAMERVQARRALALSVALA